MSREQGTRCLFGRKVGGTNWVFLRCFASLERDFDLGGGGGLLREDKVPRRSRVFENFCFGIDADFDIFGLND